MYKKLLTGAISLVICSQAMAQDYQFETRLSYVNSHAEIDRQNEDPNVQEDEYTDEDSAIASGTYYFSQVKAQDHPLAEAAFLEKNSSLSLVYNRNESSNVFHHNFDIYQFTSKDDITTSQAIIGGETYLFNDVLYLAGYLVDTVTKRTYSTTSIANNVVQGRGSSNYKDSDNIMRMNLGIAPFSGLLIWTEVDEDSSRNSSFNLNAKYLMKFNGSALNLQGGLGKNAFTHILAPTVVSNAIKTNFSSVDVDITLNSSYILSDYYFNNRFSLGLGASHTNNNYINDVYMIRSQLFFNDSISGQVAYLQDESEYSAFNLGVSLRF